MNFELIAGLVLIFGLALLLFFILRYSLFFPRVKGVAILMYHHVHESRLDYLTVSEALFERQLSWLTQQGYQSIRLSVFLDFLEQKISRAQLPAKPILFTFDDGYEDNLRLALPLLQKFNFTAALFVTSNYVEKAEAGTGAEYLKLNQLQQWAQAGMELALHSHAHESYRQLSIEAALQDLEKNRQYLTVQKLKFENVLAYPFGARPKNQLAREQLKAALKKAGLRGAFRIGNQIQAWSKLAQADRYDLHRIDIRGDDPFFEFQIKIKKGRAKRF